MEQYRLVKSAQQYNKYGIIYGKYQPPPSPHQIYKQGRDQLLNMIESQLHHNKKLISQMENKLNDQSLLSQQAIWDNTGVQKTLLEYLGELIPELKISESLSVIGKSKQDQLLKIYQQAAKNTSTSKYTAKKSFDEIKTKINKYLQMNDSQRSDSISKIIDSHLEALLKKVQKINSSINSSATFSGILDYISNEKIFWSNWGKGQTLLKAEDEKTREGILYHLEVLKGLLSQDISQGAGIVSEAYVEAVLDGVEYQTEKGLSKITESVITGSNSSAKLMDSKLAKTYAYLAKTEVKTGGGYTVRRFGGMTPDKMDIEISLESDVVKTAGLSVKNYSDTSSIALLTGNLLSILGQTKYTYYTYHFLNSYTYREKNHDKDFMTKPVSLYILMKKISAVHALIGGLMAQVKDGSIITTPEASYLAVNNSSGNQMNWKVFSTKELCDIIIKARNVDNYINFSKEFNYPRVIDKNGNIISNEKGRFTAMTVYLKLSNLKNTLTQ